MKILTKRKNQSPYALGLGIVSIRKYGVSLSAKTLEVFGLKNYKYCAIGQLPEGQLTILFTNDKNTGYRMNSKGAMSKSFGFSFNKGQIKMMSNYIGRYVMDKNFEEAVYVYYTLKLKNDE